MNQKKAKQLRSVVNNIIPLINIVGRNVYRHVKRSYNKREIPSTVDFYINRYESLYNRMFNSIKNKRLRAL